MRINGINNQNHKINVNFTAFMPLRVWSGERIVTEESTLRRVAKEFRTLLLTNDKNHPVIAALRETFDDFVPFVGSHTRDEVRSTIYDHRLLCIATGDEMEELNRLGRNPKNVSHWDKIPYGQKLREYLNRGAPFFNVYIKEEGTKVTILDAHLKIKTPPKTQSMSDSALKRKLPPKSVAPKPRKLKQRLGAGSSAAQVPVIKQTKTGQFVFADMFG